LWSRTLPERTGLSLLFGLGFAPRISGVCALERLNVLETAIAVSNCIQLGALAATMRRTFCLCHDFLST
jgi:hypothetical protein